MILYRQLFLGTNNIYPYEMHKLRKNTRENVIKMESMYPTTKDNERFPETTKRRRRGIDSSSGKRTIPTDTMILYLGFQNSEKINSYGLSPIQFVVMFKLLEETNIMTFFIQLMRIFVSPDFC